MSVINLIYMLSNNFQMTLFVDDPMRLNIGYLSIEIDQLVL